MVNMFKRLLKRQEPSSGPEQLLETGTAAPDFSLPATTEDNIRLADLRGRPIVLVFYPADESPVCSNQLALYNDATDLFQEYEAQLLGISVDDAASHAAFASSLNLNFPLLSDDDPAGEVARKYGVFNDGDGLAERALFVIDGEGTIRWHHVSPRGINPGAAGILEALETISGAN